MPTKPMTNLRAMAKRIETWLIDKLIPLARNPRTHSEAHRSPPASKNLASITRSWWIQRQAGHGRLLAARKLGLTEVPVIVLDHLSESQKRAYIIADNKLAENAGWNDELLV